VIFFIRAEALRRMNSARHEPIQRVRPGSAIGGIFVVGMFASGVELLGEALARAGLAGPHSEGSAPDSLTAFNDELLRVAGGSPDAPPDVTPTELARQLASFKEEAHRRASGVLPQGVDAAPWVWADPRLSMLAPFWAEALAVTPAVVLVHRTPTEVVEADVPEVGMAEQVVRWWDRTNRFSLVLCSQYPSLVVSYHDLMERPKVVLSEIVEFLASLGVVIEQDTAAAVDLVERAPRSAVAAATDLPQIGHQHSTLDRLLHQLDGRRTWPGAGDRVPGAVVEITADFYDEEYYRTSCDPDGAPYGRDEQVWVDFFTAVSSTIVETLRPATSLDVGCALGMLVEALRARGVDARGIDISKWAIEQVPPALQPFCRVGSITDEIEGHYDLITCIEVLEHLPPSLAEQCVGNLCRHADAVLFSSTPDDFNEPTHLNVEPSGYWARLFLGHGFVRDADYDAGYLSPQAILFRRGLNPEDLVESYERALWRDALLRRDHEQQIQKYRQLAEEKTSETAAVAEARDQLQQEAAHLGEFLQMAERRRSADALASFEMVRGYESDQRRLAALLAERDNEIEEMRNTKTFRYTTKLRGMYGRLRRRRERAPVAAVDAAFPPDGTYATWVDLFDTLDDAGRRRIEAKVAALADRPVISVVMPVYDPPLHLLRSAIESVRGQIYPDWELCIADDCSPNPDVAALLQEYADADPRIKFVRRDENGHISAASNSALSIAAGQWVAPLDHDDVLAEHALALVAFALAEHPDAGFVYSDEDKLDDVGNRRDPFFKPDFDPLLLLGQNFVSHLSVFRKDLVDRVGGYREGYEGSQDWDLTLRVSELVEPQQVVHIPHVLYHWRVHAQSTASLVSAKPYAIDSGRRAVIDHLERTGRRGRATRIGKSGHVRVSWDLPESPPQVSIVIPTRDGRLLPRCIDSVLSLTIYPNFDVFVIDNSSGSFATLSYLQNYDDRLTIIRDERPFNFAGLNNYAVDRTHGEVVCFLNDDTEIISGEWLTEMVGQLEQPGVGAVGAKLYYEDGRIQHAGVVLGIYGVAGHAHRLFDRLSPGYSGHLQLAHRMSAVTAACMVVRREAWEQVQGFDDQNLPIAFNDVDLCIRLQESGWSVVWTPYAELFHRESITRGRDDVGPRADAFKREVVYMEQRWGFDWLRRDPYYNPNLALDAEDFSLAWPPRVALEPGP
jgi:glycosyltransferase involved in cell wall biosynthesis